MFQAKVVYIAGTISTLTLEYKRQSVDYDVPVKGGKIDTSVNCSMFSIRQFNVQHEHSMSFNVDIPT